MSRKKDFIKELEYHLRKVPKSERQEMIHDIEEHFIMGEMEGKLEEEVASELGSPKMIARDMLADLQLAPNDYKEKGSSISRAILASIGLFFFNIIFILGPALAIIGVFLAFFLVGVAFSISPLIWLISLVTGQITNVLGEIFIVITIGSLGVLLTIGMLKVGKGLYKMFSSYIKLNARIVKG